MRQTTLKQSHVGKLFDGYLSNRPRDKPRRMLEEHEKNS